MRANSSNRPGGRRITRHDHHAGAGDRRQAGPRHDAHKDGARSVLDS
jgi:hypothetical protein